MEESIPISLPHLTLITIILNALGIGIKATPRIPNHWIPVILGVVGAFLHCLLAGWSGINAVIGMAAAILAVGGYETARAVLPKKKVKK